MFSRALRHFRHIALSAIALRLLGLFTAHGQSVNIALSTVGNSGNAADPSTGYGEVDYTYNIGTFDVTLTQYCAFLNDVATTDTYGLYNSKLATDSEIAGINQSGVLGSFSYSVIGNSGNDPVTYVSWLDAARFCNWLQNGQPANLGEAAGSTETGAYNLNGDTTSGLETRNAAAKWWIPSENEWYKAAFYSPQLNGGTGGYYTYATQSNTLPGNVVGSGSTGANYYANNGGNYWYSVTQAQDATANQNYLTSVGSFTNSASYYGTFDQTGDVFQWNEAIINSFRRFRGGAWDTNSTTLSSSSRLNGFTPTAEFSDVGFRVAGIDAVPEPNSWALLLTGIAGLAMTRRKFRITTRR